MRMYGGRDVSQSCECGAMNDSDSRASRAQFHQGVRQARSPIAWVCVAVQPTDGLWTTGGHEWQGGEPWN
jgi:hypothetical protein